jgi:FKBP-type peptidyl-prolyl cis-trans isomerase
MKRVLSVFSVILMVSCSTTGVEKEPKKETTQQKPNDYSLDKSHDVVDTKIFDNGLVIEWYERGSGEAVKAGDLIGIDYKVRLKDGTIVDGNHLLKLESFPFLVGFQMQTKGWDMAFQSMKVGDFARIKIPSHLARGEKGIEGVIPPNAVNFLTVRILSKMKPDRMVEGTKIWLLEENKDNKLKFNEGMEITFHSMVSSPSNPLYANTFRSNTPFKFKLGDQGIVPGLRKALINAKSSDRMYVVVPASEAYGDKGYMDFVKPNEDIFYNIMVMDVLKK